MAAPVKVEITGDAKGLFDALDKVTGGLKGFSSQIEGQFGGLTKVFDNVAGPIMKIAALVGGGAMFKGAVDATVSFAKETGSLSRALGTTAQESAVLSVAIGDIYGDVETFLGGAQKMVKILISNEAAIKKMGVATRDSNGNFRDMPGLLADINARLGQFEIGTNRDAAAATVFGRGWRDMLKYIQLTPEVMHAARKKVADLGMAMGPDAAAKVKKYRAMINDVEDSFQALKIRVGLELMPALSKLGNWFVDVGPGAITTLTNALRGLVAVLSMKTVQIGLAIAALYMMRGTVTSLITPLKTLADTIRLQMALAAMQGVTGIKAFGGALLSMVNPVTATIAVIAAAGLGLEYWISASERAAESTKKLTDAMVQNGNRFVGLSKEALDLDSIMKDTNTTTDQKAKAQKQLGIVLDQINAIYPEFNKSLKDEAGNVRDLGKEIGILTQKRKEDLEASIMAMEIQIAQMRQLQIERTVSAASTGAGLGMLGPVWTAIQGGRADSAGKAIQVLTQNLDKLREALKGVNNVGAKGEQFTGGSDTKAESAFSRMKEDLETARFEFEATGAKNKELLMWTKEMEVAWLEKSMALYAADGKQKKEIDRFYWTAKRDGLKQTHDEEIADLKSASEEYKYDALARLDLAEQVLAKESKAHSGSLAETAAARKEVHKIEQEILDDRKKWFDTFKEINEAYSTAILDLDKAEISQRRSLGEISALDELQLLRENSDKRFAIEESAIQARYDQARNENERIAAIKEMGALKGSKAKADQGFGFQIADLQRQSNGVAGFASGIRDYLESSRNAFQNWKTAVTQIISGVESSFAGFFQSIVQKGMTGAQKWDALWKGMSGAVLQALTQMMAKKLVMWGVDKAIEAWDTIRGVKKTVSLGTEAAAEVAKGTATAAAQTEIGVAYGAANAIIIPASIARVAAMGAEMAAAVSLAAAETWAAYAWIPFGGAALAEAQIALMTASIAAAPALAKLGMITGAAEGGWFDRPTLTMIGEGTRPELVVPDTSFKDFAANLSANLLAQERQSMAYQRQGAAYATAGAGGHGGGINLSGATIFTSNSTEMQNFLSRASKGYDRRNG